ncbi:MAG: hypothetical protein ABIM58_01180 [candidate division WOR-3 bacterium]
MKEEKLFYDPRSSLLLELVEEYIEHNLIIEAETLLKDYLRSSPFSERALSLWIKIAELQKDQEKVKYLKEKLREIREKKDKQIIEEEKIKIEKKEDIERKEEIELAEEKEELFDFLKGIDELEEIRENDDLLPFVTVIEAYFKKWGIGEPREIIVEKDLPEVGFKGYGKWKFLIFKKNTNFVTLRWIVKKLKWKE